MKSKIPAILALLTTVGGLVSSPLILDAIPTKWAGVVIAAGALLQAVTKAINHPE